MHLYVVEWCTWGALQSTVGRDEELVIAAKSSGCKMS